MIATRKERRLREKTEMMEKLFSLHFLRENKDDREIIFIAFLDQNQGI